jgi:hypothetical protein
LTLCNTIPIKTICPKWPIVVNSHKFLVPRVTAADRFDCIIQLAGSAIQGEACFIDIDLTETFNDEQLKDPFLD